MKITFRDPLQVEEITDESWRLLSRFQVLVEDGEARNSITVDPGFVTDFASVPRAPMVYLYAGGKAHKSAVIHDYLYERGGTIADRIYADEVFKMAMHAEGFTQDLIDAMYNAVRAFGASHFKFSE